ncbi:hypothetical protein [uncultured Alteromonas sp.]|uniref:hypothetical protein n=1 Tax=uncultured Alteromonas sp. TaxID=179113 RepID=UPI0030ED75B0|tara:strand:+ start:10227 stop:10691 length:465 start_codon:yes stop_codon:yes gene_type:complete
MAVDYPAHLRLAIQQGKKRTISKTFMNTSPLDGLMYSQRLTDQAPVIWDFNLIFNSADAADFSDWLLNDTDSGNEAVNMPIKTEQGIVIHEVRFIDIPQPREVGDTWRYSCSVQAAAIVRPEDVEVLSDLAIAGYTELDMSLIDQAINEGWPEA